MKLRKGGSERYTSRMIVSSVLYLILLIAATFLPVSWFIKLRRYLGYQANWCNDTR